MILFLFKIHCLYRKSEFLRYTHFPCPFFIIIFLDSFCWYWLGKEIKFYHYALKTVISNLTFGERFVPRHWMQNCYLYITWHIYESSLWFRRPSHCSNGRHGRTNQERGKVKKRGIGMTLFLILFTKPQWKICKKISIIIPINHIFALSKQSLKNGSRHVCYLM